MIYFKELILDHNPIGSRDFSKYGLANLGKLSLVNTSFSFPIFSYFRGLAKLKYLYLDRNRITSLRPSIQSLFNRLHIFSIKWNQLHCNCEIKWLKKVIKTVKARIVGARCYVNKTFSEGLLNAKYLCHKPKIEKISQDLTTKSGTTVILLCNAWGDPSPMVTWLYPNGEKISAAPNGDRKNFFTKNQLILRNVQISLSGTFMCAASNIMGVSSSNVSVKVLQQERKISYSQAPPSSGCKTNRMNLWVLLTYILLPRI